MDSIYEMLADIAAKRVPVDTPNVKIDAVHGKVAFVEIPEGYELEDRTEKQEQSDGEGGKVEKEVKIPRNTDERAVILLKVPQVEEEEEVEIEGADGAEGEKKFITKLVDEDQKESAIVIQSRDVSGVKIVDARQFLTHNAYAAKAFREEFLSFVQKTYPDFFEDNNDFEDILEGAHAAA